MNKKFFTATFAAVSIGVLAACGLPFTASAGGSPDGPRTAGITATIDCAGHLTGETSFNATSPAAIVLTVHDGNAAGSSALSDALPGHYPFSDQKVYAPGDTVDVWATFVFEGDVAMSTPAWTVTAPTC